MIGRLLKKINGNKTKNSVVYPAIFGNKTTQKHDFMWFINKLATSFKNQKYIYVLLHSDSDSILRQVFLP